MSKTIPKLTCDKCKKDWPYGKISVCQNCDAAQCHTCGQGEEPDMRSCSCETLCVTCRQGPSKCKGCESDGCVLCMGNDCYLCDGEADDRFDLVCDVCRSMCMACNKQVCPDHYAEYNITNNKTHEAAEQEFCTQCTVRALQAFVGRKRKRPASPTDSPSTQEASAIEAKN